MTLRRSFDNLKKLLSKITETYIPKMIKQAKALEQKDITGMNGRVLAEEVGKRKKIYDKWKKNILG